MDLTDRQLELKLCETYFSIINKTKTLNIPVPTPRQRSLTINIGSDEGHRL